MKDDLKERLDTLFSARRAPGEAAAPEGIGDGTAGDARFAALFVRRAERVVYPAMLEIGRVVERHGRFFSIEVIGERTNCRGMSIPTSVQMNFFRRQRTTNFKHACPHFNVVCDKLERKVVFQRTAIMAGGAARTEVCGRCSIDQLTSDLVQDKIAATLDVLLAG